MRHLTPRDYRRIPWTNGRGWTTEMVRVDSPDGLLWRMSMASVVEDGPFSIFCGIERNLTVISGPGFDLVGDMNLRADPLVPVAFPGDVALAVRGLVAPCEDVNVMTARCLRRAEVSVAAPGAQVAPGGLVCLFALGQCRVNEQAMACHDLCITGRPATIWGPGQVLVARLFL